MREALLRSVAGRLPAARSAGDAAGLLEPVAVAEAEQLERLLAADRTDTDAGILLGLLAWSRHPALPEGEVMDELLRAVRAFAVCFAAGAVEGIPARALPAVAAEVSGGPGIEALRRAMLLADPAAASAAVQLWRRVLDLTSDDDPDLGRRPNNLGLALHTRYSLLGDGADLDEAIACVRRAVDTGPHYHPNSAARLGNLGPALRLRFERVGECADLEEAIAVGRRAVDTTSDDNPQRPAYLANLGTALRDRFERTGEFGDLEEAIACVRGALDATPGNHPDSPGTLNSLGAVLRLRCAR